MAKKKKSTRASNGMGSIRQRSDGRWEARYTTPDGRQKSVYARTQKEVTAKLREQLHSIDVGAWVDTSDMSVDEWLNVWLSEYLTQNAYATIRKYRSVAENYIRPALGKLNSAKVKPMHVRAMLNRLQARGLTMATIKDYAIVLNTCFQAAIEAGIIRENPVRGVRLPRAQQKRFIVIDRTEIPAFLDAAKETPYENELKFLLFTGLRIGELRGLRWADCDLTAGTISVERQLHTPDGKTLPYRFSAPKYGEVRTIHIPDVAVNVLKAQRKKQLEQRVSSGKWQDDEITADLVFRRPDGSAHGARTVYNAVKTAGAAIGKPDLHPHDLRHSYAVAALRSGADVKTVQHNLGHKTAKMTLDVYAAYTDDAGRAGAEKFAEYLKNG